MDQYQPTTPEVMRIKELSRDLLTQYSPSEIILVTQQAQSATASEIAFNVKMPDSSAILHSTIWMRVKARFKMELSTGAAGASRGCWQSYDDRLRAADKVSDNIMLPGGICPIQSKMFENVSCSVNGVSFQARASEILEPIMRMTVPNTVAEKVNLPYPDYSGKRVQDFGRFSYADTALTNAQRVGPSKHYVPSDYEWKAYEKWRK